VGLFFWLGLLEVSHQHQLWLSFFGHWSSPRTRFASCFLVCVLVCQFSLLSLDCLIVHVQSSFCWSDLFGYLVFARLSICRYFALVLVGLPLINNALCADLDCLLVCSPFRALLPLVLVLCLLQWLSSVTRARIVILHWRSSNIHYRLLSSWVVNCVPCTSFYVGLLTKTGCCKLGYVWPCLSPRAPTLIHRCFSDEHNPALLAWVVFWASYNNKKQWNLRVYFKLSFLVITVMES